MPSSSVYVGIDVACAVGKRLPICAVSAGQPLMPLTIPKHLTGLIPRGVGNKEIAAAAPFQKAARDVVSTINRIVIEIRWQVERSPSMLQPHPLQQGGHRRTNWDVSVCPPSEHPRGASQPTGVVP